MMTMYFDSRPLEGHEIRLCPFCSSEDIGLRRWVRFFYRLERFPILNLPLFLILAPIVVLTSRSPMVCEHCGRRFKEPKVEMVGYVKPGEPDGWDK